MNDIQKEDYTKAIFDAIWDGKRVWDAECHIPFRIALISLWMFTKNTLIKKIKTSRNGESLQGNTKERNKNECTRSERIGQQI